MNSRFIYVLLTLTLFLYLFPVSTFADTSLSGTINTDRVLTISESPYFVFEALNIPVGVTLSVDPGVIVKFGFNGAFVVSGKLDVNGTTENKVNFTSWSDDSLGGDSNGDGNATGPSAWNGVMFLQGSIGNISNLIIQYGGQYNQNSGWSEISNSGTLTITNSLFKNVTAGFGLRQGAGTTTVVGTEFSDGPQQMFVEGGVADIKESYFHNSNGQALWMQNATVNLEDSIFDSHAADTVVAQFPTTFTHKNNAFSNNRLNGFSIGGSVKSDAVLSNENIPYLVYGLSVDAGATLSIDSGSMLKFYLLRGLQVSGALNVNGSDTEPVYFTSMNDDSIGGDSNSDGNTTLPQPLDWQSIAVSPGGIINMNYADVAYGGRQGYFSSPLPVIGNNNGTVVLNSVTIHDNPTGFYQIIGTGSIENSTFTKNDIAVVFDGGSLKIDGTSISRNDFGITTALSAASNVDARNNWWGNASGPNHNILNPSGTGDGIGDKVDFTPWLTSNPFATSTATTTPGLTPVIIIPGIAGAELYNGDDLIWPDLNQMFTDINDQFLTENLSLDSNGNSIKPIQVGEVVDELRVTIPILGSEIQVLTPFKPLIENLEQSGFARNTSYFLFPYDWRFDLSSTTSALKQKIDEIKTQTGTNKVDIVAHSMGGLLVKDYINSFGKENINKLIFVGTPHMGAPKASKVLLNGDRLGIPWLEEDRIQEIAKNSPSIYELLPNDTYFNEVSGYIKPFSLFSSGFYNYGETKNFLLDDKNLNSTVFQMAENFFAKNLQAADFSGIDAYNIVGCGTPTQSAYRLGLFGEIGGTGYTSGDETVPFGSADYVSIPSSNKYYAKKVKHVEMPSSEWVREAIVNILQGSQVNLSDNFKDDSSFCGIKGKTLTWRSPVEVHVYDSFGRHTGLIENNALESNIPGVDFDVIDGKHFIFLPTDDGQQYRIEAVGTDEGTFDLLISTNENGVDLETAVFNDIPVSTETKINFDISSDSSDTLISVQYDDEPSQTIETSTVLSGELGNDLVPPETQVHLKGKRFKKGGEFIKEVEVDFSATDNSSGVLGTWYSLDGIHFSQYTHPFKLHTRGRYTVYFYSVDKAGNNEEIKHSTVVIGKHQQVLKKH